MNWPAVASYLTLVPPAASTSISSEKTVSVHVSNLLRKTGTSSRIEVAELARRSGA